MKFELNLNYPVPAWEDRLATRLECVASTFPPSIRWVLLRRLICLGNNFVFVNFLQEFWNEILGSSVTLFVRETVL
jgi:hypothetical protein